MLVVMRPLLLICLALPAGCGDGRLDTSRFGACSDHVLDGLSPAAAYDGFELRELCVPPRYDITAPAPTVDANVPKSSGKSCSTTTCAARVAELDRLHTPTARDSSPYLSCETYLIAMKDGAVAAVGDSPETLLPILGPIDTPNEAQLYAQFQGTSCGGIAPALGGFDVLTTQTSGDCPQSVQRLVIRIGIDGSYSVVDSEPWETTNVCV
jgi:hypothetical protein